MPSAADILRHLLEDDSNGPDSVESDIKALLSGGNEPAYYASSSGSRWFNGRIWNGLQAQPLLPRKVDHILPAHIVVLRRKSQHAEC